MKVYIKITRLLLTVFLTGLLIVGCKNYYKATPARVGTLTEKASTVNSLRLSNRYFILRTGSESFYMKNPMLSADQKTLECTLDTLSSATLEHIIKMQTGNMKYHKNEPDELFVLNEVHFYIPPDTAVAYGKFTLDLDKVQKIELIEKDTKRTANSHVIGAIGFTLGALAVVAIIVAATKSSCPFVSAYNGNEFNLQGEIYGGAIYPQLVRHDFIPLKMATLQDGTLQVKISNELKEIQYTDMAELWVINHDKNVKMLADEKGNLYSIASPESPVSATLNAKKDVKKSLLQQADNELLYMDDTSNSNARNEVSLQFNKPAGAQKGKLLLTLKNSYWVDLLYGELAKGFGTHYAAYKQKQLKKPAGELLRWVKEQQLPLQVTIKTNKGWEQVTNITTIGPLATREIVVPVDVTDISTNIVDIKLSSGFMFWEIDYAAIDFSAEEGYIIQKLSPQKATDEVGNNVLPELQKEDGKYLIQPAIGNVTTIVYKEPEPVKQSSMQTFILHTKGYYEYIRNFNNKPDKKFLMQFAKPNAFAVYGMALYKKIKKENLQALASGK